MVDAVARFTGFAAEYDSARPSPPPVLADLLSGYADTARPVVVDLGAGTGLATTMWLGRAASVTAVEPSADMAELARRRLADHPDATVRSGTAESTGLPEGTADVVTASQAMHWFDLDRALPEIARILRPGGVFAAFDCDWPPTVHPAVDAAYLAFEDTYRRLDTGENAPPRNPKHLHHQRLTESGLFTVTRELAVHHEESGDAARLLAVANSQGGVVAMKGAGCTDADLGLDGLATVAARHLATARPWWWTYRVRLAVL